jgi:putative N6-adenine-specific DNA methylase
VARAVSDAVRGATPADAEPDALAVLVRGENDSFVASVDSSGELLHRRGARTEIGEAPLRETLAAGLLALAGWRPDVALYDPMCGAGTIPIEACAIALDVAPGMNRAFALDRWPALAAAPPETARRLRGEARGRIRPASPAPIAGSDRDPQMIEVARRNTERAGFGAHIAFACADLADARAPAAQGLVLLNPPYGRRLHPTRPPARALREMGRALRARFSGWRAGVLLPAAADPAALGLPVVARHRLRNGGLAVALVVCEIP